MSSNLIFVICGPSGVGKGSLTQKILDNVKDLDRCISWTTRPMRKGEVDGVDYHFSDDKTFIEMKAAGMVFGGTVPQFKFNYWINLDDIIKSQQNNRNVLVESNLNGVGLFKERFENVISLFVIPPSLEELKRRLRLRGREVIEEEFQSRIEQAREIMLLQPYNNLIDYRFVNKNLEECSRKMISIINKEEEGISE